MSEDRKIHILKYLRDETRPSFSLKTIIIGRLEIVSFLLTTVLLVVLALLVYFDAKIEYALIIILIITFVILLPVLVVVVTEIRSLKYPTDLVLESANERMNVQDLKISMLSKERLIDLKKVIDHLEYESLGLQFRTLLIVGSIAKLGPIPAVLLIYTTYYLKLSELLPLAMVASALVLVIFTYVLGVSAMLVSERIRMMVYLTKCAKQEVENRSEEYRSNAVYGKTEQSNEAVT